MPLSNEVEIKQFQPILENCDTGGCTVSQAPSISRISQDVAISLFANVELLFMMRHLSSLRYHRSEQLSNANILAF